MEFVIVPTKVLLTDKLSDKAKIVYFLLQKYAYDKITCYPSINTLEKELDVTKITIVRAMNELKKYGLIKVYRENNFTHNVYILLPIEWVTFTEVSEDEIYVNNEEELEVLKANIVRYYEENGLELVSKKKKKRQGASVKSPEDVIKEVEDKIASNVELTTGDYAKYLFKRVYEEYGQVVSYSGVKVNSIFKKLFKDLDKEDALLIIDTYVKMYNDNFKKVGFEAPLPQYLGIGWIYNKVINRANNIKRSNIQEDELDITF